MPARECYKNLPERLRLELPAWEDLSKCNLRKLFTFLVRLHSLTAAQKRLLLKCIKECGSEMKARAFNGKLTSTCAVEVIRTVAGKNKKRIVLKSHLATIYAYRGISAKGKEGTSKRAEREKRKQRRLLAA